MGLKLEKPIASARPDERGRITLGSNLTSDVSRYDIFVDEATGNVLLKPYKEVPANEAWFFQNEKAQKLVAQGINEAKNSKLKKIDLKKSSWIDEIEDD